MCRNENLVPLQLRKHETLLEEPPRTGGFFRVFLFFCFFLLFVYASDLFMKRREKIEKQKEENHILEKLVKELELKNQDLKEKIDELKTREGEERIARERLGLIKPGEKIVEWERIHD